MNHTFLFEEGIWIAEGIYSDYKNRIISAKGETEIMHKKEFWISESKLVLKMEDRDPIEIRSRYNIKPFGKSSDHSTWVSENEFIGKLEGNYIVVGDTIISSYTSEYGGYIGTDVMVMIDKTKYKNRGCLFKDEKKISSWIVELTKK